MKKTMAWIIVVFLAAIFSLFLLGLIGAFLYKMREVLGDWYGVAFVAIGTAAMLCSFNWGMGQIYPDWKRKDDGKSGGNFGAERGKR